MQLAQICTHPWIGKKLAGKFNSPKIKKSYAVFKWQKLKTKSLLPLQNKMLSKTVATLLHAKPRMAERKSKNLSAHTIVRILILFWSSALLTLGYAGKLEKMDPTFVAAVFTSTLASFGIDAQTNRNGSGQASTRTYKTINRKNNTTNTSK
jgi:hypothetical protein